MHDPRQNQMTIHTAPGCTLTGDTSAYTGTRLNENCDSSQGSIGCSIRSDSDISYGAGFNEAGGGVFALLWDGAGLKMWNWPRANVPRDLTARAPEPLTWGKPVAVFDRASCDPYTYFHAQVIIMNVNMCGESCLNFSVDYWVIYGRTRWYPFLLAPAHLTPSLFLADKTSTRCHR